jgi:hypothetical protein
MPRQLEKQQAELEKARSDFQELRKSSRAAFEKATGSINGGVPNGWMVKGKSY